ncbi:hypothetical protein H1R20_g5631, partial [Candolleomyces eurysporus]
MRCAIFGTAFMTSTPSTSNAPPPVVVPGSGKNIVINSLQRGNPVLECIRNVGKEFGDIIADYQVGRTTGVLYLSLRYHRLHPEYIHNRIEKLGHSYNLRILLILCDVTEHKDVIRELTKSCLINNITIIVAFSTDEAGHYLSTFKQFEHRPPDLIKERTEKDYNSVLRNTLTSISKVNKTDVETLRSSFGSFANISRATSDQLQNLPGFGQVKVKNLRNAFDKPFRNNATTTLLSASQIQSSQAAASTSTAQPSAPTAGGRLNSNEDDEAEAVAGPSKPRPRPPREPSPDWDIELGFEPLDNDDIDIPPRPPSPRRPLPTDPERERSLAAQPEFDIDLDLN